MTPTQAVQTATEINGEHIARRCAGHSCADRNRCAWHVEPVPEGLTVVWERYYEKWSV